jgi:hypothetical protein
MTSYWVNVCELECGLSLSLVIPAKNKSIVRIRNPLIFKLISCMGEIIYRK